MRIVFLSQMDAALAVHYAVALSRRGHEVTAVHTGEPTGESDRVPELDAIELLTPYRGGLRSERRHFLLWAVADRGRGLLRPAKELAAALYGRTDRLLVRNVVESIVDRKPDVVFAHWGLNAYPEVWALVRLPGRRFPVVYGWNSYPMGDELSDTRGCNAIDRRLARGVEGRVHASPRARNLMQERVGFWRGEDLVFPDGFSELARPRESKPRHSHQDGEPHLLTHGTWHARPDREADFLGPLRLLAEAGLHVHYPECDPTHPPPSGGDPWRQRLHPYRRFEVRDTLRGEVFSEGARCDAALVLYRPARPWLRFRTLIPTRFLSAVACGLPVVLPRGLLPACEDFLAAHENGFTFESPGDLLAKLLDRSRMAILKERARCLEERFFLEARLPQLEALFQKAAGLMA